MPRNTLLTSTLVLAAGAAVVRLSRRSGRFGDVVPLSRRALLKIGGLGLGAIVTGAWRGSSGARAASSATLSPGVSCVLTPELTQGPYYIANEKVRSNIAENRHGTPLKLRFTVVDAATCKPIKGAAVDIWHCDAGGIYSGFEAASTGGPGGAGGPTDKDTFLRGIQRTNAKGEVHFTSIYPGWYRGRTVHIHVKVHAGGAVVHTGQLFFRDSLTHRVYEAAPYRARAAARDTFNSTDSIFSQGGARSMLSMKHDGHGGFIGSITMGVKR